MKLNTLLKEAPVGKLTPYKGSQITGNDTSIMKVKSELFYVGVKLSVPYTDEAGDIYYIYYVEIQDKAKSKTGWYMQERLVVKITKKYKDQNALTKRIIEIVYAEIRKLEKSIIPLGTQCTETIKERVSLISNS
jgi:cob(I)alamin adenosyltransferase